MLVKANLSLEVYAYYKGYDLSAIADTLLELYDFTSLPPISGNRGKEVTLNIGNELYISLYNTLGPRSKKVSLGRLLEFGYNMDVLSMPRFNAFFKSLPVDNPTASLLGKAYKLLLQAQTYDDSDELKTITSLVYDYIKVKEV